MTDLKIDRPIAGDITRRNRNIVPQQGAEDFLAALDKVFAFDYVEAIGWTQYTPYFMDGDPCEFGINEIAVKIGSKEDADGDAYAFGDGWYTSYGLYTYTDKYPQPNYSTLSGLRSGTPEYTEARAAYDRASKLYYSDDNRSFEIEGHDVQELKLVLESIPWAAFENVMEDNFGDHAKVEATREGFNVEFYEHD